MKKLIIGIFLVQMIIMAAIGIPAGGAANAIWKDKTTGVVVRQDSPANLVGSYYRLLDERSYKAAVKLFESTIQESINGDLLAASLESTGYYNSRLVKVIPSNVIGKYAVAASVRINNNSPEQPVLALITLRENEGKWEIVQQMNDAEMEEVREVFERAIEVCDLIVKDPFAGLTETQTANLKIQAEMGSQYIKTNLAQLNVMLESVK